VAQQVLLSLLAHAFKPGV